MNSRRYGLMRPEGAARGIALVLCLGLVVGFSSTYLLSAGVPVWVVLILAVLVVGVPVVAALRSGSNSPKGGSKSPKKRGRR